MSEQPNDRKFFIGRYGQKRYAADHTFYWDRQGLHMALAFWVVAIAIALFEILGGGLTGVIAAADGLHGWRSSPGSSTYTRPESPTTSTTKPG